MGRHRLRNLVNDTSVCLIPLVAANFLDVVKRALVGHIVLAIVPERWPLPVSLNGFSYWDF